MPFPLLLVPVAVGAYVAYWPSLVWYYSARVPRVDDIPGVYNKMRPTPDIERENIEKIMVAFQWAGYHVNVARAAVANAYAESAMNGESVGDSGQSLGIFQIHGMHGKRTFSGDRKDTDYAIRWILDNEKGPLMAIDISARAGAKLGAVTADFSSLVERPKDVIGERTKRSGIARVVFPVVA